MITLILVHSVSTDETEIGSEQRGCSQKSFEKEGKTCVPWLILSFGNEVTKLTYPFSKKKRKTKFTYNYVSYVYCPFRPMSSS